MNDDVMKASGEQQDVMLGICFGNFFEPAYSDRSFIDDSMKKIAGLGFDVVELDSKAWEDFQERFSGGDASDYVAQQEYMMDRIGREHMGYMFLALYMCGDNLYPHIRTSPPVLGEGITWADGTPGQWYKYWSEKAMDSQVEHVRGLMKLYGARQAVRRIGGRERLPVCSMWDPVVVPSFDAEGQKRYRDWLEKRYGTVEKLNSAYGTCFRDFASLKPEDWWYSLAFDRPYDRSDLEGDTRAFRMWTDNMCWRRDELTSYFAHMQKRLHELDPRLYLMPNLSQWGHYLNMDTFRETELNAIDLWDTASRGVDMRALAPYVDAARYDAVPLNDAGDPEPYAVSCQHAHMRSMNRGRPFLGGIYYGRYLYNDLYRFLTPEEMIGSIVMSGASGIMAYGWCGLDDGGVLHRMGDDFLDSLRRGNAWAREVIPCLGERRRSRVAILYPTAMALLEPFSVEGAAQRRSDFLGMYRACRQFGYDPEIVELPDVRAGLEADVLLIPADECYHAVPDPEAEEMLRQFVSRGGVVIHGPDADMVRSAFGLEKEKTEGTCFTYCGEGGIAPGGPVCAWPGEPFALWREDGKHALSRTVWGKGQIFSFGFLAGYAYGSRTSQHVPYSQGRKELYPLPLMEHEMLREILEKAAAPEVPFAGKDVESTWFEHGLVIVNHRSAPLRLDVKGTCRFSQPGPEGTLPGHSCVFVENPEA